jgi:hypothetical protein
MLNPSLNCTENQLLDEKRKIFSASMSGTSSFARRRDEPKQKRSKTANDKTMTTTKSNPNKVVQPYLFFEGRCEEAIEFYRNALGAEVEMLMRFKDNPDDSLPLHKLHRVEVIAPLLPRWKTEATFG